MLLATGKEKESESAQATASQRVQTLRLPGAQAVSSPGEDPGRGLPKVPLSSWDLGLTSCS